MVADLHSSISKGPEMKTGGAGRGTKEEAPNYHRDTVQLMDSRTAVRMWLTPWLTESPTPPDVDCQQAQEGASDRKTERGEEG